MTTNPVAGIAGMSKVCQVYRCAQEHGVDQCGLCDEFPCLLLVHFAAQSGDERITSAAVRAQIGDELWAAWARQQRLWVDAFCPLRTATKIES